MFISVRGEELASLVALLQTSGWDALEMHSVEYQALSFIKDLATKPYFCMLKRSCMFLTKKLCTLFFQNHCKKHKETKLFFLKCSIYYFYYILTLWWVCTDNAVHGTIYVGSIIEKPSSRGEKI